jgi:hypothetical protein
MHNSRLTSKITTRWSGLKKKIRVISKTQSNDIDFFHTQNAAKTYLFPQFYLSNNIDVAESGVDPLTHFMEHGKYEDRSPNPFLDLVFYRQHMMSLAPGYSYDNAFDHFIHVGAANDLWTSAFFDPVYYRNLYSEIDGRYIHAPLEHFLTIGLLKGYFCTHPAYEELYKHDKAHLHRHK